MCCCEPTFTPNNPRSLNHDGKTSLFPHSLKPVFPVRQPICSGCHTSCCLPGEPWPSMEMDEADSCLRWTTGAPLGSILTPQALFLTHRQFCVPSLGNMNVPSQFLRHNKCWYFGRWCCNSDSEELTLVIFIEESSLRILHLSTTNIQICKNIFLIVKVLHKPTIQKRTNDRKLKHSHSWHWVFKIWLTFYSIYRSHMLLCFSIHKSASYISPTSPSSLTR